MPAGSGAREGPRDGQCLPLHQSTSHRRGHARFQKGPRPQMSTPSYPNECRPRGRQGGGCTQGVGSIPVPGTATGLPAKHAQARTHSRCAAGTTWGRQGHAGATGSWLAPALAWRSRGQSGPRTASTLPRPAPAAPVLGSQRARPGREEPAGSASKTASSRDTASFVTGGHVQLDKPVRSEVTPHRAPGRVWAALGVTGEGPAA